MTRRILCKILLVVVAVLGLFVLSSVSAQGNRDTAFERVKAVQAAHTNRLMAIKGVVGTAIGHDQGNAPVITVLVEKANLAGIPRKLDGVPVQPVVTGKIYALKKPDKPGKPPKPDPDPEPPVDPTARFDRPVPIGVSTGHPDITAGTIGCRVTDGTNVYALSNNHVFANENDASTGDDVLQPGTYDGGTDPADAIGTLADFEPIVFYDYANPPVPIPTNTIDAAIALSLTANLGNATPSDGYGVPKSTIVAPSLRLKLQKYGRTTGLTSGKITAVNATVDVGYDSGVARFINQIIIIPSGFSAGGDSGSLVVTQKGKNPVGLLFAGSARVTIANPIDAVLERFGVTVDGE